jgi:putative phosphoribosyl transferase
MYFRNRAEAGRKLAKKLETYEGQQVVVLALSPGAVIIGAQVAMKLHANMALLLTESVFLPGETDPIAAMSSAGIFTYNNMFSPGQIEEYVSEYHHFIEEKRLEKLHQLNKMMGKDGEVKKEYLRNHIVICISDGLSSGFSLDIAAAFLKTVHIKRLVVATPLASVPAVDRMHLFADDIICLSVVSNWFTTNHYYDDNTIPATEHLFDLMRNISLNWDRGAKQNESKRFLRRRPGRDSSNEENFRRQPEVFRH